MKLNKEVFIDENIDGFFSSFNFDELDITELDYPTVRLLMKWQLWVEDVKNGFIPIYFTPYEINYLNSNLIDGLAKCETKAPLIDSCKYGYLRTVKWLVKHLKFWNKQLSDAFICACINGQLEVAKWFIETYGKSFIKKDFQLHFRDLCYNGCFEVAKWFFEIFPTIDLHYKNYYSPFANACIYGHLEIAEWLWEKMTFSPNDSLQWIFDDVCGRGHFEIAEWMLCKFPNIMVESRHFYEACYKGDLSLAKWITNTFPDIHHNNGGLICKIADIGKLDVLQWLLDTFPTNKSEIRTLLKDKTIEPKVKAILSSYQT